MKTLWYVARKDLLQVVKDRNSFILMLVVPFILILVIGVALGGIFNTSTQPITINVALSNQDHDVLGNTITDALKINSNQLSIHVKQYTTPEQVKQAVADNKGSVTGVVIPAGTTAKLSAAAQHGQRTQDLVQVYTIPTTNDPGSAIIQNIVGSVTGQLSTSYFASGEAIKQVQGVCQQAGNHCAAGSVDPATIARQVGAASLIESQAQQVASLRAGNVPQQLNTFDLSLPGYVLLFALFGIQSVAATILQEKEDGTLRRLLIAPIQKYALLGGKLLAQFIITFGQALILFVIGYFAFHLHIPDWPTVLALLIGTSFATTGLGILLVSLVRTRRQLSPVVMIVSLTTSAIGGAWWPLSLEPTWMQQFAKVGITAWAMEGLNGSMLSGLNFMQVLPDVLGLLGYGAICFVIGLRLFRFQPKTA